MSWAKITAIALFVIGLLVVCLTFEVWAAAFLGILFALSLNGLADWIRSKWQMPAWAATLLSMLMVLTVLTGLGFMIGPPVVGQADEMGKKLPAAMKKSLNWLEEREWGRYVVRQVESLSGMSAQQDDSEGEANDGHRVLSQPLTIDPAKQRPLPAVDAVDSSETGLVSDASDEVAAGRQTDSAQEHPVDGNGDKNGDSMEDGRSIVFPILQTLTNMLSVTASTIMLLMVSFVVTIYVALNPDVYRRGILWMIPVEHEAVATQTMSRMCVTLRWWMLGRLASMFAVGLLTSLGMWLIGMPAPLALGAMAGLLSFVPNIGPIVAAVPGLLIAVPAGPWMFLAALGVYVVAQIIESNLITPLVAQYTVTTPPAVLLFAQVIMGVLAGAWGVLIATPLLVVMMVLIQQLYVREYIKKPIKVIGSTEDETLDEETDNQQASRRPLVP